MTGVTAVLAKLFGVLIAPGFRGIASQKTMDLVDTVSATLAYALTALLIALVCAASFELARSSRVPFVIRAAIVAFSGLVVALASPAVIGRLHSAAALMLAVVTSLIALAAGLTAVRSPHTRALGAVVTLLALAGAVRPFSWQLYSMSADHTDLRLFDVATASACSGVILQALATLLAAIWLATRSPYAGRLGANIAVILSFALTWLGLRETSSADSPIIAILRTSFDQLVQPNLPFGISAVAAFLVPASIFLGLLSVIQRAHAPAIAAGLTLMLISGGAFDVPLQALAAVAGAQWALLAMGDDRGVWARLMAERQRSGVKQPTSPASPSA